MTALTRLLPAPLVATLLACGEAYGASEGPVPVGPGDLLNVGTGLLLVVGAILLCGWLYTRTQKLRGGASDLIRIIASQPLGAKERVVLLQVADQQLLVGMTSTQVQTLHVFEQPITINEVPTESFAARLRAAVKGQAQ